MVTQPFSAGETESAPEQVDTPNLKPIPSCPGYLAGEDGSIWSTAYGRRRMSTPTELNGYVRAYLFVGGRQRARFVHRLVVEAFIATIPIGMEVNHLDGVKVNNTPGNLEICTRQQNAKHAYDHGLLFKVGQWKALRTKEKRSQGGSNS
jgi:hypothetical protein